MKTKLCWIRGLLAVALFSVVARADTSSISGTYVSGAWTTTDGGGYGHVAFSGHIYAPHAVDEGGTHYQYYTALVDGNPDLGTAHTSHIAQVSGTDATSGDPTGTLISGLTYDMDDNGPQTLRVKTWRTGTREDDSEYVVYQDVETTSFDVQWTPIGYQTVTRIHNASEFGVQLRFIQDDVLVHTSELGAGATVTFNYTDWGSVDAVAVYAHVSGIQKVGESFFVNPDESVNFFVGLVSPVATEPATVEMTMDTNRASTPDSKKTAWTGTDSTLTAALFREGVDKIVAANADGPLGNTTTGGSGDVVTAIGSLSGNVTTALGNIVTATGNVTEAVNAAKSSTDGLKVSLGGNATTGNVSASANSAMSDVTTAAHTAAGGSSAATSNFAATGLGNFTTGNTSSTSTSDWYALIFGDTVGHEMPASISGSVQTLLDEIRPLFFNALLWGGVLLFYLAAVSIFAPHVRDVNALNPPGQATEGVFLLVPGATAVRATIKGAAMASLIVIAWGAAIAYINGMDMKGFASGTMFTYGAATAGGSSRLLAAMSRFTTWIPVGAYLELSASLLVFRIVLAVSQTFTATITKFLSWCVVFAFVAQHAKSAELTIAPPPGLEMVIFNGDGPALFGAGTEIQVGGGTAAKVAVPDDGESYVFHVITLQAADGETIAEDDYAVIGGRDSWLGSSRYFDGTQLGYFQHEKNRPWSFTAEELHRMVDPVLVLALAAIGVGVPLWAARKAARVSM